MPKTLTPEEEKLRKELLSIVLRIAGTDERRIHRAISTALAAKNELQDDARRNMLWAELKKKAVPRVRAAKKKLEECQPSLV